MKHKTACQVCETTKPTDSKSWSHFLCQFRLNRRYCCYSFWHLIKMRRSVGCRSGRVHQRVYGTHQSVCIVTLCQSSWQVHFAGLAYIYCASNNFIAKPALSMQCACTTTIPVSSSDRFDFVEWVRCPSHNLRSLHFAKCSSCPVHFWKVKRKTLHFMASLKQYNSFYFFCRPGWGSWWNTGSLQLENLRHTA